MYACADGMKFENDFYGTTVLAECTAGNTAPLPADMPKCVTGNYLIQ